jgi:hypothetical protein
MEQIKIDKNGYLQYDGHVLIIKLDDNYDFCKFQYNGIVCGHKMLKGFIADRFVSESKYFCPKHWINMTSWGSRFPNAIFFNTGKYYGPDEVQWNVDVNTYFDELNSYADSNSISCFDILNSILQEIRQKTGKNYRINLPDYNEAYGVHWFESYIPLVLEDEQYVLTWQNCD